MYFNNAVALALQRGDKAKAVRIFAVGFTTLSLAAICGWAIVLGTSWRFLLAGSGGEEAGGEASLATVAVLLKQELLLVFIGGVYVVEAFSGMLQVASFKMRGKRVFKMAPLHHHFEQLGWAESKVIVRFWIAGLVMALFALTTLKLR